MTLTDAEKIDRLDGIYAWDGYCRGSGIHDIGFKEELRKNSEEAERLLKLYALRLLSQPECGWEDVVCLVDWARRELEIEY